MADPLLTRDDYRNMLDEIDRDGENLTGWEIGFVESMMRQMDDEGRTPTYKQQDVIERLYRDRMP